MAGNFRATFMRIHQLFVLALAASIATIARAQSVSVDRQCVVLGFGRWLPDNPGWLRASWREVTPPIALLRTPIRRSQQVSRGWRSVSAAPTRGIDTAAKPGDDPYAWPISSMIQGWRAIGPDSLALAHFVALGEGVTIRGRWIGDTLRARAHSSSDAIHPRTEPRANAFAIRYDCRDPLQGNQQRSPRSGCRSPTDRTRH